MRIAAGAANWCGKRGETQVFQTGFAIEASDK
ncbi:hypothetical protein Nmel_005701 [Mimus melanotis]